MPKWLKSQDHQDRIVRKSDLNIGLKSGLHCFMNDFLNWIFSTFWLKYPMSKYIFDRLNFGTNYNIARFTSQQY
jgi:hypothetical protein